MLQKISADKVICFPFSSKVNGEVTEEKNSLTFNEIPLLVVVAKFSPNMLYAVDLMELINARCHISVVPTFSKHWIKSFAKFYKTFHFSLDSSLGFLSFTINRNV